MSIAKQIIVIIVLTVIGVGVWAGLQWNVSGAAGGSEEQAVSRHGGGPAPVVVAPVVRSATRTQIRAVGTGEAAQAAVLHPDAAGTIKEVLYSAGDRVDVGATLVRLDDAEERLALDLAKSELADAQRALDRVEKLRSTGVAPVTQLEQAQVALVAARHGLAAAELALAKRTVKAPFSGVVGIKLASVGAAVTTSSPVATLDDRSTLLVEFELPERYAGQVDVGQPVSATTAAFPSDVIEGAVHALDSRVDEVTRTLRVQASIPNNGDRLRPGMSFAVNLAFEGSPTPTVPELAIQWDNKGSYVWVVREDVAHRVPVTVVERRDGVVMVSGPLSTDDQVVVEGVQRMREGASITAVGKGAPLS